MSEKTAKSGRPWTRILLVVSLGLNLAVAGVFLGARLSDDPPRKSDARASQDMSIGPYGRALSQEGRTAMREAFAARRSEFRKSRQQMRALGRDLIIAMQSEPFDLSAVEDILTQQGALQSAFQMEGRSLLLEHIGTMTSEQRAAFADRLEKGLDRGKRRERQ